MAFEAAPCRCNQQIDQPSGQVNQFFSREFLRSLRTPVYSRELRLESDKCRPSCVGRGTIGPDNRPEDCDRTTRLGGATGEYFATGKHRHLILPQSCAPIHGSGSVAHAAQHHLARHLMCRIGASSSKLFSQEQRLFDVSVSESIFLEEK